MNGDSGKNLDEVYTVLRQISERLIASEIDYFVGGSVATTVYGSPRMTRDIDIVVVLTVDSVSQLAATLEPDFLIDTDLAQAAIASTTDDAAFNIIHLATMLKVDLFIHRSSPWQNSALLRRIPVLLGTATDTFSVYIASPEDMVLQKLRWYRLTGERSDRQWSDVQGVLSEQTELDLAYMQRFANEAGVEDLLGRAIAEAGS